MIIKCYFKMTNRSLRFSPDWKKRLRNRRETNKLKKRNTLFGFGFKLSVLSLNTVFEMIP